MKQATITLLIALMLSALGVVAQPALPGTSYKYQTTQRVCRQLANAFGEQRLPKLTITASPAGHRIAQYVSKPEPELFLDEKLYDICRQFGADSLSALAVVLGHELTHYYGKHSDWFGFAHLLTRQRPTQPQSEHALVLEAQADLQGTFRAFLAGYKAFKVIRPLYQAIYAVYKLPVQMPSYPDRDVRIQLLEQQAEVANRLSMAYEVGLFFLLSREYHLAQRCFLFVSAEMPLKEVLHNIGLCQLLQSAQQMSLREMPYRYPFELETGNRLRTEASRGDEMDKVDLLKEAVANFQQAVELDATYATANINLATALLLLGRTGTAKERIDLLEASLLEINKPLPPNARMVRGIALLEAGLYESGRAELLRSKGAQAAAYNLKIAQLIAAEPKGKWDTLQIQQLAEVYNNPLTPRLAPSAKKTATRSSLPSHPPTFTTHLAIPAPALVRISGQPTAEGDFYQIVLADASYTIFLSRPSGKAVTATGLQAGDAVDVLLRRYGEPPYVMAAAEGVAFYCYILENLFVAVQNGVVRNWYSFEKR